MCGIEHYHVPLAEWYLGRVYRSRTYLDVTIASTFEWVTRRTRFGGCETDAIPQPRMLSRVYATQLFCGEGRSLLNRAESCRDSRRMDDIKHPNDFPPLTIEQIRRLAESIQDAFGSDFSRAEFTNHLLALLEDVPGFEIGDVSASLIESAWGIYSGGRS